MLQQKIQVCYTFKQHKPLARLFLGHSKGGKGKIRRQVFSLVTKVHGLHRGAPL